MTASPNPDWKPLLPDNVAKRYLVVRHLGSGGMGEAFLADDTLLHRKVVVKRMAPHLSANASDRQRFLSEAKRAAAINSPHIVQIYDVLDMQGEFLLILEYVDGSSLRSRRGQKLAPAQFFPIAESIAEGVAAAHASHVVHCDLKPENILLSRSGDIKILDFGLARPTARQDAATISLTQPKFAGTPGYMAPEMIREQDIDERADIFALGVIFYELLTGIAPFTCDTLLDTLHKTVNDDPPPVVLANADLPPEIDWILGKMLAKDRDERYGSVREVITDLTTCRRKLRGDLTRNTRLSVTAPPRRFRARTLIVAIALLACLTVGAAIAWRQTHPAVEPVHYRSVAVLPLQIVGESSAKDLAYAHGICSTLTAKLASVAADHELQVTPASEVLRRKIDNASAAAQQLGADLVIEGQLQNSGREIRVNYALVDARTMRQLRSGDITAKLDDPFTLEDRIVTGALNMLDVQLQASEIRSLTNRGTTNPAAYDLFLTGSGYLREYQDTSNVDRAIESFQKALTKDADYAQADAALGRAYWLKYESTHAASMAEEARASCEAAVKKNAALPDSHLCLGIVEGGTGQYEEAVRELETAVDAEPRNDVALRELGALYEKTKQPARAEMVYQRGIAAQPHYWAGYSHLGSFYSRQARYEEAAVQYRRALDQNPGNALLYYSLGGIYIFQGKYADAVETLNKAVQLQPTPDAYRNLGQAFLHLRKYDGAISAFQQAIALDDREYMNYSALGDAYFWSGAHKMDAAAAYQKSNELALERLRVNPRDQALNIMVAYNYAALSRETEALDHLQRAQKENPGDSETMFFAARIFARLGHPSEALTWLRQSIAHGYSRADIEACPDLDALMRDPAVRQAEGKL